jgi:nucleolar protein 4
VRFVLLLHLNRIFPVIRPGTAAAAGMSESDARRREQIDVSNRRKLNNLHIFVSPTRLVVHNLPKSCTDQQLHTICMQAVDDKTAKIKEVGRI